MNIGIITPYYPDPKTTNSGLANHFFTLATGLTNIGNNVVVVHIRPAYEHDTDSFEQAETGPLTVLTYKVALPGWINAKLRNRWAALDFLIKLKCMYLAFLNFNRLKKKYDLHVIETTSYYSLCYLCLFKKQSIPLVVRVSTTLLQMMDNYFPYRSRLLRAIGVMEIWMIKKSNFLITHATDHALEMEKLYGIKANKFTIIPHGIELPPIKPSGFNDHDKVKILYVGRLEYRKGIDVLLKAIPQVLTACPEAYFNIIGNDEANEYENHFKQQNPPAIINNVMFSGNLDNNAINKAYSNCDIFVAPSRYESFGLIYIEAMSFGKPVIGCRVGGVPEIIENNKNGLFANAGDPLDLADKITCLIRNKDLREQMGLNARQTVEAKFTRKRLCENSVAYYKNAIITLN